MQLRFYLQSTNRVGDGKASVEMRASPNAPENKDLAGGEATLSLPGLDAELANDFDHGRHYIVTIEAVPVVPA